MSAKDLPKITAIDLVQNSKSPREDPSRSTKDTAGALPEVSRLFSDLLATVLVQQTIIKK
jgi:hypothetical protein